MNALHSTIDELVAKHALLLEVVDTAPDVKTAFEAIRASGELVEAAALLVKVAFDTPETRSFLQRVRESRAKTSERIIELETLQRDLASLRDASANVNTHHRNAP